MKNQRFLPGFNLPGCCDLPFNKLAHRRCTGGQEKMMSKVQCLFCSESCTTEGRGGEKGREFKFQKIAHRTFDIIFSWPPV